MFKRIGEIALVIFVWSIVVAYVVYASVTYIRHNSVQTVKRVDINITDSTAKGQLVTSNKVREWILQGGIKTIGICTNDVDVMNIQNIVTRNGFVDKADVYVTYSGTIGIDISQRRPVVRLMVDGYNSYITEDGFVFVAPESSSMYVPVVSGEYRPVFPPTYEGYICDYMSAYMSDIDQRIQRIEDEKGVVYADEKRLKDSVRAIRRMRIEKHWLERKTEYDIRLETFRKGKAMRIREYNDLLRESRCKIETMTIQQEAIRAELRKKEEKYDDFLKLINFVKSVESDDFWSAEVVQIVASTTSSGVIELEIIPRSGDFRIVFGDLTDIDQRFDKLLRFYHYGLGRIGWDRFKTINLRYNNQVVCTE